MPKAHAAVECTCSRAAMAFAAAALFLLPQWAEAGPPFVTDDPEPVKQGHWEINIATQSQWTRDEQSGFLLGADINYGQSEDVQLHMGLPWAFNRTDGVLSGGYGDTELGVKWRPIHEARFVRWLPADGHFIRFLSCPPAMPPATWAMATPNFSCRSGYRKAGGKSTVKWTRPTAAAADGCAPARTT